jgi:hypothetical protein
VSFEVGNAGAYAARAVAFNKGLANAVDSFAGGSSATVDSAHNGSFIWGGRPFTDDASRVHTGAANQFVVYSDGGFLLNASTLPVGTDDFVLAPRAAGDADSDLAFVTRGGVNTGRIYVSNANGIMQISATNGVHINNPVSIQDGLKVEGAASKTTAGAWQANSDGRIKQDIAPVEDALDTLAEIHPVTFRYTEAGPEGLLKDKRAVVIETRAGVYSSGPAAAMDGQEPHLRTMLGFMGIDQVRFVRVEGMAFGPEAAAAAIEAAAEELRGLAGQALPLAA